MSFENRAVHIDSEQQRSKVGLGGGLQSNALPNLRQHVNLKASGAGFKSRYAQKFTEEHHKSRQIEHEQPYAANVDHDRFVPGHESSSGADVSKNSEPPLH